MSGGSSGCGWSLQLLKLEAHLASECVCGCACLHAAQLQVDGCLGLDRMVCWYPAQRALSCKRPSRLSRPHSTDWPADAARRSSPFR